MQPDEKRKRRTVTHQATDRRHRLRRVDSRSAIRWLILLACLAAAGVTVFAHVRGIHSLGDFGVYWRAAGQVRRGVSPYAEGAFYPYTYPPLTAWLYVPLSYLPLSLARWVHFGLSLALCAGVLGILRHRAQVPVALLLLLVATPPIVRSLGLGQVNPVVFLLILADFLVVPRRYRGILLGLAAGIKITPAFMAIVYALRGDWRSVWRCVASFVATVLIGVWVSLQDSKDFWLSLLWDSARVGNGSYPDNQSITGAMSRILGENSLFTGLAGVLTVLVLVIMVLAIRGFVHTGDEFGALTAALIASTLVAPIAWSHHWIGATLLVVLLWHRGHRVVALVVLGASALSPLWVSGRLGEVAAPSLGYGLATSTLTAVGVFGLLWLWRHARQDRAAADAGSAASSALRAR